MKSNLHNKQFLELLFMLIAFDLLLPEFETSSFINLRTSTKTDAGKPKLCYNQTQPVNVQCF